MERHFFDWSEPALPAIAKFLIEKYRNGDEIDLSRAIVVFPGKQASRRFIELLAELSDDRAIPPQTITVGALPEILYPLKKPFASALTQTLAWADALQKISRQRLVEVIPQPPEDHDVDAWLNLGELLRKQHRELATDRLDFAQVAEKGTSLEGFNEQVRWSVLAEIQKEYWERLDELDLWDQQTARLYAIEHNECQTQLDIILVGTVDLNKTLQAMLQQVSDRVFALIHAPESLSNCFEEFGNLKASAWENLNIDIDEAQIHIVDGPQEQAAQVILDLADLGADYACDDVTVCVPDERIVPHITRALKQHGLKSNWVIQRKLPESGPYRLLAATATYLEADRTDHFSELIRHPDVTRWLNQQQLPGDWLTRWDTHVVEHLQRRASVVPGGKVKAAVPRKLVELIRKLTLPLRGSARPLAEWGAPIREFLIKIYGELPLSPEHPDDRVLIQAAEVIHATCLEHGKIPEALTPVVTAPRAIDMTLSQLTGEFVGALPESAAVQLSGWLDLPLDDAPVAIITSLNEGLIPSAVNHDLFLPNRLRVHLGLEDNTRRFARDAYALNVVLNSRKSVRLIAAKHDVRKEPLTPSRLLFATNPETIAQRIVRFYDEHDQTMTKHIVGPVTTQLHSDFKIPRPVPESHPGRSFRVTQFKDYITSPYRYYLRHVLGLGAVSDSVVELDPAGFGSLIHDVLQLFGESEVSQQTDPRQIFRFLDSQLDQLVKARYDVDPLFPVHVQVEQIRYRLNLFAEWQAEWIRQGWQIRFTEVGKGKTVKFDLGDGTSIDIRGRIDRIDYNANRDEWMIFDYKTSDRGASPEQTHRQQGEWVDLQLPLYRYLAQPYGVKGNVRLAYITLPRTTTQIGDQIADWTEDDLRDADQKTREIALKILRQEFWVEQDRPPRWEDDYAPICQDGVFEQEAIL